MKSIEPFLHGKVVVLHQDRNAFQAARAMYDNSIGCVVVSDTQGEPIGILTDRDLACCLVAFSMSVQTRLSDLMSTNLAAVNEDTSLEEVVQLMKSRGVRRIPVLRGTGEGTRCAGIISFDDLVAARAIDPADAADIVNAQLIPRRLSARYEPLERTASRRAGRSEAHMRQTLRRFFHALADGMQLPVENAEKTARFILGCLVQRMQPTSAAHLVAQLPRLLQEDLLDLPAGPDRKMNVPRILNELRTRFGYDGESADRVLKRFCQALETVVEPHEIEKIKTQLPPELRSLFPEVPRAKAA